MKDKLKVKMVCYKDTPDASILEKELEGGWACMKRSWIVSYIIIYIYTVDIYRVKHNASGQR